MGISLETPKNWVEFSLDDAAVTRMSTTPVAVARKRAGISVTSLAAALGITEPACWDLLYHPSEVSMCLTLRQFMQLASVLAVQLGKWDFHNSTRRPSTFTGSRCSGLSQGSSHPS